MSSRLMKGGLFLGSASAALAIATSAFGHATVNPGSAPAGSYAKLDIRVPHGCDGEATTAVRVQIPDGVVSVKPEAKSNWDVETKTGPITPYDSHGTTISEGVVEVTWKNGNLPDDLFEDFGLSVKLPDKPGETLWWKIVQECTKGEVAWIEIPKEGSAEPEHPAAGLVLTASEGDSHGHTDASADTPSVKSADAVSSDDSSNVVSWLAMAVGALGLVAGAGSFVMRRR